MDPDAALIRRAQEGDTRAFRQLFTRHQGTVSRIVYRMIGPSPDVEDVVQDVFLNVYRSLPSFRGDSKFSTWLYRLATNVTRMHLRRGRSRPRFADVEVPEERAKRRMADLAARGEAFDFAEVLARQEERDHRDRTRSVGPLIQASDAIEIFTDGMTTDQVIDRLESLVQERRDED